MKKNRIVSNAILPITIIIIVALAGIMTKLNEKMAYADGTVEIPCKINIDEIKDQLGNDVTTGITVKIHIAPSDSSGQDEITANVDEVGKKYSGIFDVTTPTDGSSVSYSVYSIIEIDGNLVKTTESKSVEVDQTTTNVDEVVFDLGKLTCEKGYKVTDVTLKNDTVQGHIGDPFNNLTMPEISQIKLNGGTPITDKTTIDSIVRISWDKESKYNPMATSQTISGDVESKNIELYTIDNAAMSKACSITLSKYKLTSLPTPSLQLKHDDISSIDDLRTEINRITTLSISTDGGVKTATGVTWDTTTSISTYQPSRSDTQNFTVPIKTITLPDDVEAGIYDINTITMAVSVAGTITYEKFSLEDEGFKIEIKSEDVKSILEKQTGELARLIDQAQRDGSKLSVAVKIESIDEDDDDHNSKIKDKANKDKNGKVAKYYKITMHLVVGNKTIDKPLITDSEKKVTFKYSVDELGLSSPDSKLTRKYKAFYYHSDAKGIGEWKAASSGTYSFNANEFSPYGIAYTDLDSNGNPTSTTPTVTPTTSASLPSQGNDPGTAGGTDKSKTPKTGDDFNPRIWIYLLIVCATVASAAWILLQDTRDDSEKKQN